MVNGVVKDVCMQNPKLLSQETNPSIQNSKREGFTIIGMMVGLLVLKLSL